MPVATGSAGPLAADAAVASCSAARPRPSPASGAPPSPAPGGAVVDEVQVHRHGRGDALPPVGRGDVRRAADVAGRAQHAGRRVDAPDLAAIDGERRGDGGSEDRRREGDRRRLLAEVHVDGGVGRADGQRAERAVVTAGVVAPEERAVVVAGRSVTRAVDGGGIQRAPVKDGGSAGAPAGGSGGGDDQTGEEEKAEARGMHVQNEQLTTSRYLFELFIALFRSIFFAALARPCALTSNTGIDLHRATCAHLRASFHVFGGS